MVNHIAIFDNLNDAAYESLCSLRCIIDGDQLVWTFGVRHLGRLKYRFAVDSQSIPDGSRK